MRTWRLRGLYAKIRCPYQDKSDRVAGCIAFLSAVSFADEGAACCGGVAVPVSRGWCKSSAPHGPYSLDFSYCIYDWDNSFATLLAAAGAPNTTAPPDDDGGDGGGPEEVGFAMAMSNLVQTAKASTSAGFIPNNDGGGGKSEDRAEPPVIAKTALQLTAKFGVARMRWVLEVILPDMLDFIDWFFRNRIAAPLGLVALGGSHGDMQCARYESGLDDSPMYDGRGSTGHEPNLGGSFMNSTTQLMELYDVGQSSMVVRRKRCWPRHQRDDATLPNLPHVVSLGARGPGSGRARRDARRQAGAGRAADGPCEQCCSDHGA